MSMTRLLGIGAGVMAALVCAACGPSVEIGTGGGGGATGTGGTAGTAGNTGTGGGCPPQQVCCTVGQTEPCCAPLCGTTTTGTGMGGAGGATTTSTTTTGTGMGGAGGGTICGGFAGTPCAVDEFCKFPDERCGGNDNSGVCTKRPQGCPAIFQPTCACDGKVYGNPCDANSQGTDVNDGASCTPPAGMFGCGAHFCTAGMEYCQMNVSDVGNFPSTFQCQSLPASCGAAASCACLAGVPCGGLCMATPNGGLQVTCPGG